MEKDNIVCIKKIPLESFIEYLTSVFDEGGVYIDIIGTTNEVQDSIGIVVWQPVINELIPKEKLKKEDFNKLI